MAGNEERAVIEALIQSTGLFVGLPHEDPQRHIQNFLEITDTYNYPNFSKDYFFPTKKTKVLRSQILGFEQRAGETFRQAWERYKKILRDCPHHCQTDEVLGHTFVDGLDDASKMNLDSACGGSCMARPYSEIQILLNNFTTNDNNWKGEGDSWKDIKQKSAGLLELDEVSAMRVDIAKLANRMTRMTMQQPKPMQHVPQMAICCELCGDNHMSDMCPTNPESIYYVGQQNRGRPNQHARYGNSYNPNWRNHPNFSWGGNRNLERQLGQLATNQNTRPAGALPSDTEKNPQVNSVTLRNGRELEEVLKKRKDKHVPEGELIPKVTNEPKKTAEIPEPAEAPRPPPPFPQRLQKKNDDRMFSKILSMLSQVQLNIPLVDVLREIP
uniref:Uncharacterized protein LOC104232551 n=1 Tax=Nicotiana sylvestris TaxID=4096 RepID=A0A1U7XC98_NICSY|nr:PREDICTED: uncharacterized protein LOC104232551 [Nicotiana sylvestris]